MVKMSKTHIFRVNTIWKCQRTTISKQQQNKYTFKIQCIICFYKWKECTSDVLTVSVCVFNVPVVPNCGFKPIHRHWTDSKIFLFYCHCSNCQKTNINNNNNNNNHTVEDDDEQPKLHDFLSLCLCQSFIRFTNTLINIWGR